MLYVASAEMAKKRGVKVLHELKGYGAWPVVHQE